MKLVIGLAGVKTSGKSTVANIIKRVMGETGMGYNVQEAALADKLKNACSLVFNVPRENFDRQDLKEVPFETPKILFKDRIEAILELFNVEPTEQLIQKYFTNDIVDMELESPRQIAQIIGTEILRETGDEDIHCKNLNLNEDGITIVSDLRFPNEFNFFNRAKLMGYEFLPLYIQRDEAEQYVTENSHPSETSVFKFSNQCLGVPNNGSLRGLENKIIQLLSNYGYLKVKDPVDENRKRA
jgi:hypothetical protein